MTGLYDNERFTPPLVTDISTFEIHVSNEYKESINLVG